MIYRIWDKENKTYSTSSCLLVRRDGDVLNFHFEPYDDYYNVVTDKYEVEYGFEHNGVEYYQGDILTPNGKDGRYKNISHCIQWSKKYFQWECKNIDNGAVTPFYVYISLYEDFKVAGNIHESP